MVLKFDPIPNDPTSRIPTKSIRTIPMTPIVRSARLPKNVKKLIWIYYSQIYEYEKQKIEDEDSDSDEINYIT